MENIVIVGFGGHAKSMVDAIENAGHYNIIGFTDREKRDSYRGYPYLGTDDTLAELYHEGVKNACIGVGYLGQSVIRDKLYGMLISIGYQLPAIIDASAVIASDAVIGSGSFVGKIAVVNSACHVGEMCIINTGVILDHECTVGNYSHIAVGARLCGDVHIADHSMVGAGATVIQSRHIGSNVIVGAGSTVIGDVVSNQTVYGIVKA